MALRAVSRSAVPRSRSARPDDAPSSSGRANPRRRSTCARSQCGTRPCVSPLPPTSGPRDPCGQPRRCPTGASSSARTSTERPAAEDTAGLWLIDPKDWSRRVLSTKSTWFRVAGGLIFARGETGVGLRIIQPSGSTRELFRTGSVARVTVVGPRAFVTFFGTNIKAAVVELGTPRRQTPRPRLPTGRRRAADHRLNQPPWPAAATRLSSARADDRDRQSGRDGERCRRGLPCRRPARRHDGRRPERAHARPRRQAGLELCPTSTRSSRRPSSCSRSHRPTRRARSPPTSPPRPGGRAPGRSSPTGTRSRPRLHASSPTSSPTAGSSSSTARSPAGRRVPTTAPASTCPAPGQPSSATRAPPGSTCASSARRSGSPQR